MFTVFPDTGVQKMQENDVQDIDVLSLLTVDKVYVDAGDTVKAGDLLATVDTVFVKTALQTFQKELYSLDSQIEDAKDDTVSTKIKSSVSGRVKKIYAAKGDGVTDVMQEDGALALISLDGKMAVEITVASEHLSGAFCVAMHMNNDPVDHFCVLRVSTGYAKKMAPAANAKKNKKRLTPAGYTDIITSVSKMNIAGVVQW